MTQQPTRAPIDKSPPPPSPIPDSRLRLRERARGQGQGEGPAKICQKPKEIDGTFSTFAKSQTHPPTIRLLFPWLFLVRLWAFLVSR
jgi:hypothetical protein